MSYKYKHTYRLLIAKPPEINTTPTIISPDTSDNQVVTLDGDYRTEQLTAIEITDLSMTARIASTTTTGKSTSTITVKGLSEDNRSFVENNSIVLLEAGFEDELLPVIFAGQVVDFDTYQDKEVPEIVIKCSDGYTPSLSVKVSKYYPEGTSALQIIEDLANEYGNNGIPLGRPVSDLSSLLGQAMDLPIDQITYSSSTVLVGNLEKVLKKFLKSVGFKSYLSNSRLYIEPINYNDGQVESLELKPWHVLSVRPSSTNSATTQTPKSTEQNKTGYKLKTLLDGRFEIGKFVDLKIEDILEGVFKIVDVNHVLDFEGESWFSEMEIQNV